MFNIKPCPFYFFSSLYKYKIFTLLQNTIYVKNFSMLEKSFFMIPSIGNKF